MLAEWIPKSTCIVPAHVLFTRQNSECACATAALLFLVASEPLKKKGKGKGTDLRQSCLDSLSKQDDDVIGKIATAHTASRMAKE